MAERYGEAAKAEHFRSFDTICSATQERQDAIVQLLADEREPLDLMLIVGGYNSSNTTHLAALAREKGVRGYHIEDADCIDPAAGTIRHQPVGTRAETQEAGWLPPASSATPLTIGLTAGASTPNNKIGDTVARICATAGLADELARVLAA
jgi:4-hydroxy-3-methylbut-2-enyl diphosphate reductase